MKRVSIIAVCLLTTIGCTPSNNNPTPNPPPQQNQNPTVNATEQQLVGTWYLDQEKVTSTLPGQDTTYTGYSNAFYIKFTTDQFGSISQGGAANWKTYQSTWVGSFYQYPTTPSNNVTDYWYIADATPSLLSLVVYQYTIVTLTTNQLVVKTTTASLTIESTFHK